jgi:hypothetical protein
MDTDTFFERLKRRVAELEADGKRRVPADIKKTIRQRPRHGYRLDSLEKLAEALDWSVPELLAGIWQTAKFNEDAVPFGLRRHAICLNFARKTSAANPLMSPALEERRLESRAAELYQTWVELERKAGKDIDAETITAVFEEIEERAAALLEERQRDRTSAAPSEQPDDPSALEKKAAPDDDGEQKLVA